MVREDPAKEGLLYAGTEIGLYVSFDAGKRWQSFQNNLPIVPITDLKVHQGDLIAATQGRAFWILDNLSPLYEINESIAEQNLHLFSFKDPYLVEGSRQDSLPDRGTNPDNGLVCYYSVKEELDSAHLQLDVLNARGDILRSFSSNEKEKSKQIKATQGSHKFVWDLRMESYDMPKGLMVYGGKSGHKVGPGTYNVRMILDADTLYQAFKVLTDPRLEITEGAFKEQQQLLAQTRTALTELYTTVKDMQHVKSQMEGFLERKDWEDEELKQTGKEIVGKIDSMHSTLVQQKQKTFQDVINYPNQLNAKLVHIQQRIDGAIPPVTEGQKKRVADLLKEWEAADQLIQQLMEVEVGSFNQKVAELAIPLIATEIPVEGK